MSETMIDLSDHFKTSVVSGRNAGAELKKRFGLDRVDPSSKIVIKVPKSVQTVTASFLGGLLGTTIALLNSHALVSQKVVFLVEGDDVALKESAIRSTLDREISRVLSSSKPLL